MNLLIDYSYGERVKQKEIICKLGGEEILSQCSEECCELGKAAQKMLLVSRGTTPVTMDEARAMLVEKAGDVLLLLDCLISMGLLDLDEVKRSALRKNTRWFRRTVLHEGH